MRSGGNAVIRQAISCDICAMEKKLTNHWFVALEQGGELRVSGLNARTRLRPGMKHLCGHTCLHKLVDDFMARTIDVRAQQSAQEESVRERPAAATNASLTAVAAYEPVVYEAVDSSARSIPAPLPPAPLLPKRPVLRPQAELVAMPGRGPTEEPVPLDEPPRFASRNWRAEAWDRERERELRAVERRPGMSPRRRAGS